MKKRRKHIFALARQPDISQSIILWFVAFVCSMLLFNANGREWKEPEGITLADNTVFQTESANLRFRNSSAPDILHRIDIQAGNDTQTPEVNDVNGDSYDQADPEDFSVMDNGTVSFDYEEQESVFPPKENYMEENHSEEKNSEENHLEEIYLEEKNPDEILWEEMHGRYFINEGMRDPSEDRVPSGPFTWPLEKPGVITSYFGWRTDPFTGEAEYHNGIDIAADKGIPILAAADGVVMEAEDKDLSFDGWGYYVKLRHSDGYETLYAHCSAIAVKMGDMVQRGQIIGYTGSTGHANGVHLHWEVYQDGFTTNPMSLFVKNS